MKNHINLALLSIPLTIALIVIYGFLSDHSLAMYLRSVLSVKSSQGLEVLYILENVTYAILVSAPYAFILSRFIKMPVLFLAPLTLVYFLVIYAVWGVVEGHGFDLFAGITFTNQQLVCVALLVLSAFFSRNRRKNA